MTSIAGSIAPAGSPSTGYFLDEWTVYTIWHVDGKDPQYGAKATPDAAGDYSINDPDTYTRDIEVVAFQPLGTPWQASEAVVVGDYRHPSAGISDFVLRCDTGGTTDGTETAWGDPTHGDIITEAGGVKWQVINVRGAASNRGMPVQRIVDVAGDSIYDTYSNAAAIYSLRLLNLDYTGNCLRVRRSSDDLERDIGFDGTDLDTAALLDFCGAGDGFVTIWYDQSGNEYQASQGTTGNQPQIVSSGSLVTESGVIALDFDGTNDALSITGAGLGIFRNIGFAAAFYVAKSDSTSTVQRLFEFSTGGGSSVSRFISDATSSNRFRVGGRRLDSDSFDFATSDTDHNGGYRQISAIADYANADAFLYENGTLTASNTSFLTAGNTEDTDSVDASIGADGAGSLRHWDGIIQEIVFYNTDILSSRSDIEADQAGYFGIS